MNSDKHGDNAQPREDRVPETRELSGLMPEMRRFRWGTGVIGLMSVGLLAPRLFAAPANDDGQFVNLERLSDRVTLAYWVGLDRRCNLTAIRSGKGLVIIDTEMSPRVMAPIKSKLEQAFGRSDWAYVINTHAHDSHPGGNILFPGAVIVGHENLAEDMRWITRRQTEAGWRNQELERAERYIRNLQTNLLGGARSSPAEARMVRGEIRFWELHNQDLRVGYELVKPSLSFSENHLLDMGDVQLRLMFFGKGHSSSDILIYVPQEKLLVTGGIIYGRAQFPEIGEESKLQDVRRYVAVLSRLLADDVKIEHVVPSHSPPLLKQDMVPVRDYYQKMLSGLEAARQKGLTLDQAKARLPASAFPAFRDTPAGSWSHDMHARNLRNLWRILQAHE